MECLELLERYGDDGMVRSVGAARWDWDANRAAELYEDVKEVCMTTLGECYDRDPECPYKGGRE